MGRVIKLVIYYFLYNLVFMGVVFGVYGFVNHTSDMPQSGPVYFNLSMWVQLFATLALGIHLLAWKYVTRKDLSFDFPNTAKVLLASVVLSVGMGLWTNYLTELTELPNVMEDLFNKMMYNPLGVISIVVMAPIVEELLFRGGMQGHLLRKWKNPAWAILVSALIFGIVHGNPVQMFFASILGLVLGWVYYRTGSLLPCILMLHTVKTTPTRARQMAPVVPKASVMVSSSPPDRWKSNTEVPLLIKCINMQGNRLPVR